MKNVFFTILFFIINLISSTAQVADRVEGISPLLISEKVPSVQVTSMNGESESLADIVAQQRTVIIIYRGGWCPYCNLHLSAVGQVEKEIIELGYQVIAISPDSPEDLKVTMEEDKLNYALYSDSDAVLIKAMGLAFIDEDSDLNPVPALFIVETDGTIVFEYISLKYQQRISANLLLDVLKHYEEKN
jgi:peroxiredoxin